jgi:hypothetical protein
MAFHPNIWKSHKAETEEIGKMQYDFSKISQFFNYCIHNSEIVEMLDKECKILVSKFTNDLKVIQTNT